MTAELPVLVGIDGSRDGLIALDWAAPYAELRHAPLHAVHVVDEHRHVPASTARTGSNDGSEVLDDAVHELERIGFTNASLEARSGNPAKVLLELSERTQALVVGRRGLGGFAELMLGSTSQVCTALSTDVPLIVVPDTWDPAAPPHGRIVVGVDGSFEGQAALRFAFELAAATKVELHCVHAVPRHEIYPAEDLLSRTLAPCQAKYPEVVVAQCGVTDPPVRALARESEVADLVVVGGTGQTAFSELRLGSVARGLLHHSHCPVAVIHTPEDPLP